MTKIQELRAREKQVQASLTEARAIVEAKRAELAPLEERRNALRSELSKIHGDMIVELQKKNREAA